MRVRMNERRERRFENLKDATDEGTMSGALDVAAEFYIKQAGDNPGMPKGQLKELMQLAKEEGSLTGEEIAEVLHTEEYPISYDVELSTGRD